ncbi:transcription and mRNA export factor ENY2-like [Sminthopsis crassicaudata]|uniref:transcription and mRNA export factor ENY2-like n=1 Tax=Sminthopsis crassicaudata TaxID=9301 RepID=UPI003D682A49
MQFLAQEMNRLGKNRGLEAVAQFLQLRLTSRTTPWRSSSYFLHRKQKPVLKTYKKLAWAPGKEMHCEGDNQDLGISSPGYSPGNCCAQRKINKMDIDAPLRAIISQKLIKTGEGEPLQEWLRAKLIECGWKDQIKALCQDVIKEKGVGHIIVAHLAAEIAPKGRGLVPHSVKEELVQRIRTFLGQHASL